MWTPKTERCAFLVENLDLEAATGYPGAKWERFQLEHLNDDSTFRIEVKSRQIAWSWLTAAEGVADGLLNGVGSVYVSINLDEAKEKIRYAHMVIEGLPKSMRPKLLTDNRTELEFDNGARLLSLPATAPRGKAQMNVYLDEFAHVRDDTIIYTAALPMITKGNRRLRVASSPMGASGRFWEVATQSLRKYPGYARKSTPWWEVIAFCRDASGAYRQAPTMTTAERVARFGNERISVIYENMPEEDFRQEYETAFVDETTAWITWDEIKAVTDNGLACYLAKGRESKIDQAKQAIDDLAEAGLEFVFAAGVDIGRTRDTTELSLCGLSTLDSYPLRAMITLDNCDFDSQMAVLRYALNRLNVARMLIDDTGLGMQLAETLRKEFPTVVEGLTFTNASKLLLATNSKMLIQQRRTPLPADKDIAYQIHSIKRKVTPSKNVSFDVEASAKHHADKYWSWALALLAANMDTAAPQEGVVVQNEEVSISVY
jgi:phage FluMu gp28-like protein